jgi:putative ABC transport system permease protein
MDLRYGFRRLASTPGFTTVAVLTLALGISATTAMYSVVDALLLRPLPYADADQLQQIYSVREGGQSYRPLTYDQLTEWRAHKDVFAAVEPFEPRAITLAGSGEPELIFGASLGGGVMTMLGARPQLGRLILPEDAEAGRDRVTVLSDAIWRVKFGGDPGIVGRQVQFDDQTYDVIGVMPPSFRFPSQRTSVWMPLPLVRERNSRPAFYSTVVRMRADLTAVTAQERTGTIAAALQAAKPVPGGWQLRFRPLRDMNRNERSALYVLFGAVSLVLLIACANLANLLLVRGAGREREVAVRTALGATRVRIVCLLLAETLVLAASGGAVGVLLAWYAVEFIAVSIPSDLTFLNANAIAMDPRVLAFAAALTFVTAAAFGVLPALRTSRSMPHESLKAGAPSTTGAPRQERLRRAFVIAQLALSLVLLVGAGLLGRTFLRMVRVDPGFSAENLVSAAIMLPGWKYRTLQAHRGFYDTVAERLQALPGVRAATFAGGAPPTGGGFMFGLKFEIEGRGVVLDDKRVMLPFAQVLPGYFSVLGIPLRSGRTFTATDPAETIIVNETMARRLWKGDSPLGQRIRFDQDEKWHTVVGVAGDVYQFEVTQPRGQFAMYLPLGRSVTTQMTVLVRTAGDAEQMIPAIKQQIWSVDPNQPLVRIGTIRGAYAEFFDVPRFYALLMGSFAAIGLVIAAIGLHGVLAYSIAQRTREFGIRIALGAGPEDVVRMVLRSSGAMVAAGLALGIAGSYVVTRYLESLLVEIPRTDAITYAAVIATLAAIGLAAAWVPARRATRVDPIVALRTE